MSSCCHVHSCFPLHTNTWSPTVKLSTGYPSDSRSDLRRSARSYQSVVGISRPTQWCARRRRGGDLEDTSSCIGCQLLSAWWCPLPKRRLWTVESCCACMCAHIRQRMREPNREGKRGNTESKRDIKDKKGKTENENKGENILHSQCRVAKPASQPASQPTHLLVSHHTASISPTASRFSRRLRCAAACSVQPPRLQERRHTHTPIIISRQSEEKGSKQGMGLCASAVL